MSQMLAEMKAKIRARVAELSAEIGLDASNLGDDDVIPATGLLDSAGILALIQWCEVTFELELDFDEINLDNFGTVSRMADHISQILNRTNPSQPA